MGHTFNKQKTQKLYSAEPVSFTILPSIPGEGCIYLHCHYGIIFSEIKRHFGKKQLRPVVHIGLCLGSNYKITEVNLVDRSGFNYQLLVGREYLKSNSIVDPSVAYQKEPDCGKR